MGKVIAPLVFVTCLAVLAIAYFFYDPVLSEEEAPVLESDANIKEREVMEAAVLRIAAESRGDLPQPTVEAAPQVHKSPKPVEPNAIGSTPLPPNGIHLGRTVFIFFFPLHNPLIYCG